MPDSVSTYSESILMLAADTRLYPEKDGGRVFHAFHGVFNISTVDNPYTRWITFPEYTECERCVKLYRQKKLDANNSPII